ncbi:hypothetical protein LLB_3288 [Legionella longbeachae D-4968]|nr:hypothetical protein LLB_3288 [Legionella longbeachae D-4968]
MIKSTNGKQTKKIQNHCGTNGNPAEAYIENQNTAKIDEKERNRSNPINFIAQWLIRVVLIFTDNPTVYQIS